MGLLLMAMLAGAGALDIVAHYPDANGAGPLSVRGDGCGLSWTADTSMRQAGPDRWSVSLACSGSDVLNFKIRASQTWQVGANEMAQKSPGCVDVYPWFGTQLGEAERDIVFLFFLFGSVSHWSA